MRCMADMDANLDAHSYPTTTSELIAAYGETELELQNGTETVGEALSRLGETTYENADAARTAVLSAVSEDAIGRKGYSDRDAPTVGGTSPPPLSL